MNTNHIFFRRYFPIAAVKNVWWIIRFRHGVSAETDLCEGIRNHVHFVSKLEYSPRFYSIIHNNNCNIAEKALEKRKKKKCKEMNSLLKVIFCFTLRKVTFTLSSVSFNTLDKKQPKNLIIYFLQMFLFVRTRKL